MPDDKKNALNLVDQLLANEGKEEKVKKVYKKRVTKPEVKPNTGYWEGDILQISKEDKEKAGLPADAFIVVMDTPTSLREASVFCPWYSIYGWGESTMDAVSACLSNIVAYKNNHPTAAAELVQSFKGWEPKRKPLANLKKESKKGVADILKSEGL